MTRDEVLDKLNISSRTLLRMKNSGRLVPTIGGDYDSDDVELVCLQDRPDDLRTLVRENTVLRAICTEMHWMARRYADMRSTYAPGILNDCTKQLLRLDVKLNEESDGIIWARDGMGRKFDGLTDEQATPGTSAARGELFGEL